jgi:hypothetical protein
MGRPAAILATSIRRRTRDPEVMDLCDHVFAPVNKPRDRKEYMKGYMRRWRQKQKGAG